MNPDDRKHLQDIYMTKKKEEDLLTPQPQLAEKVIDEHKRILHIEVVKHVLLGLFSLILLLSLVYLIAQRYIVNPKKDLVIDTISPDYIPRFHLKKDEEWVLDFNSDFGNPDWTGTGKRPINSYWIKKAAFNIVMGQQAIQIKKYKSAIIFYKNALEIFPEIKDVKVPLGMLYFQTKQFDKALAILKDTSDEDLTSEIQNNMGVACLDAKAYEQAEKYLKRALKEDENYPAPYKNLALVYKGQGKEGQAIKNFERYIVLKPDDLDTRHSYALYLISIGRWEMAATVLEKLTKEITDVPNLYFLLARAENKIGHSTKAIEAFKRGMQLSDSSSSLAYMNDKEFDKLRKDKDFKALIKKAEEKK
jgi:tetratricopeptide (TPR) repeat protein